MSLFGNMSLFVGFDDYPVSGVEEATIPEVIAWLRERGVGEEVVGFGPIGQPADRWVPPEKSMGEGPTHLVIPLRSVEEGNQ